MSSSQETNRASQPLVLPGFFSYAEAVTDRGNNRVSAMAHSFFGIVPKIIVTPPLRTRVKRVRNIKPKRVVDKTRLAYERRVLAALNKAPPKFEEEFFRRLRGVGVVVRGKVITSESSLNSRMRAYKAFKQMWLYEHNESHKEPPRPKYSHLKPGKVWSRPTQRLPRSVPDFSKSDKAQEGRYIRPGKVVRSVVLLTKLRAIIHCLRVSRVGHTFCVSYPSTSVRVVHPKPFVVHGEMDSPTPHGDGESLDEKIEQNVALQTHAIDSSAAPLGGGTIVMRKLAGDDVETDYSALVERWLQVKTITWKGTESVGTELINLDLPYDVFTEGTGKKNDCGVETPSHLPFKIYQYWHGDLEIRIQANTNRFQQGMLQCAWYYVPSYDSKFSVRTNIYSNSYTDHCLLDAASSNDMRLYIPYKSFRARLPTRYRPDMGVPMLLGRLSVRVLNPLMLGTGDTSVAAVTVFIRFPKSSFSGMVNSDVGSISGEMLPMATAMAMQYLMNRYGDNNRDKPPLQQNHTTIVPQTSQSFCIGTNIVEPIQALRLDALGQTPHPEGTTDEMSVGYVSRKFGYIRTIEWKNDHTDGTKLYTFDASPMFSVSQYSSITIDNNLCYYMPPVAVMSNLFAFWRGELELRIDVVATQYHTGRLMVAYIPGYLGDVNICQARGSHYKVFDLHSDRQFSMVIPYIADRPWWPRRYDAGLRVDEQPAPGRIVIFVHNQLIAMQNVNSSVQLNCYWRAGPTFEVSIPVQPSIGLAYNARSRSEDKLEVYAKAGYYPYYVGSWSYLVDSTKPVLRYGAVTQHIAQFVNIDVENYYQPKNKSAILQFRNSEGQVVYANYLLPLDVGDGYGAIYFACASSTKQLKEVYTKLEGGVRIMLPKPDWTKLPTLGSTTGNPWLPDSQGNATYVGTSLTTLLNEIVADDFVVIAEMGEREQVTNASIILPSTSTTENGVVTFGEVFNDLKTLCRRYELYSTHSIRVSPSTKIGVVHIKLPLILQGLDFDVNTSLVRNYLRDGVIPLIASGYRFFRGGMRIKIIVNNPGSVGIWVAHRPERKLLHLTPYISNAHNVDDMYNFGYALSYQNLDINNTLTLEIPFYQPGSLGLLQRPFLFKNEINSHISLGDLAIGFHSEFQNSRDVEVAIFYSLADDCRFSSFQGFPPMLMCREIPFKPVSGEWGIEDPEYLYFSQFCNKVTGELGCLNFFSNVKFSAPENNFTNAAESKWASSLVMLVSQLAQVFVHRTISSAFIALGGILAHIGLGNVRTIWGLIQKLTGLVSGWGVSPEQSIDTSVKPESFESTFNAKDCATAVGALLSTMCVAANIQSFEIKSVGSFVKILTKCVTEISRGGFFIMRFFEGIFELIAKLCIYIRNKLFPKDILGYIKSSSAEIVKVWAEEASVLLHPANEDKIMASPQWFDRLDVSYHIGATLQASAVLVDRSKREEALNASCIMALQGKLHNLRIRAQVNGRGTTTRVEPFCIWVHGQAGIGKSHLASFISNALLAEINMKYHGDPIYVYPAKSNFMDGLRDQPIFLFDDFNAVSDVSNESFNTFMALNSCATYVPNQAHLEDKGRRYAPVIVYVNANAMFINDGAIKDSDAFHRRRDILVDVKVLAGSKPAWQIVRDANGEVSTEQRQAILNSLCFSVADNPVDSNCSWSNVMQYDNFLQLAKSKFKQYHANATRSYLDRVNNMAKHMPETDVYLPLEQQILDIADRLKNNKTNPILVDPLAKYISLFNKSSSPSVEPTASTSKIKPEMHEGDQTPSPPGSCIVNIDKKQFHPSSHAEALANLPDPPESFLSAEDLQDIQTVIDTTSSSYPDTVIFSCANNLPDIPVPQDIAVPSEVHDTIVKERISQWLNLGTIDEVFDWQRYRGKIASLSPVELEEYVKAVFTAVSANKTDVGTSTQSLEMLLEEQEHIFLASVKDYYFKCYKNVMSTHPKWKYMNISFVEKHLINAVEQFVIKRGLISVPLVSNYIYALKSSQSSRDKLMRQCPNARFELIPGGYFSPPPTDPSKPNTFFADWPMDNSMYKYKTFTHIYGGCIHTPEALATAIFDPFSCTFMDSLCNPISMYACNENNCIIHDVNNWKKYLAYLRREFITWRNFYNFDYPLLAKGAFKTILEIPNNIDPNQQYVEVLRRPYKRCLLGTIWDNIYNFVSNHLIATLTTIGFLVAAVTAYNKRDVIKQKLGQYVPDAVSKRYQKLRNMFKTNYDSMSKEEVEEMISLEGELQSSGDTNKVIRRTHTTGIRRKELVGESLNETYSTQIHTIVNLIQRNTFFIHLTGTHRNTGEYVSELGRCFGIGGCHALVPYHYKMKLDMLDNVDVFYKTEFVSIRILPDQLKWTRMSNCELCLVKFPLNSTAFKKLTHFFPSEESVQNDLPREALFVEFDTNYEVTLKVVEIDVTKEITMENEGVVDILSNVIVYRHHAPGKCGSLLVDTRRNCTIIGMHVAGGAGIGVSEPLVAETFIDNKIHDFVDLTPRYLSNGPAKIVLNNNFTPIGITKPELAHNETGISAIIPSVIQGVFPVRTYPAPLTPKDPRINHSPLLTGVEKHGMVITGFNRRDVKLVYKDYLHTILTTVKPIRNPIGVLPLDIACNGLDGSDNYKSITLSTSEGFPYSKFRPIGAVNKKWLFAIEDNKIVGIHNMVMDSIKEKNSLRQVNIVPATVFIDCLKDARVLASKINQPGKTRIFSISPIDFTIVFRQYFLDFIAAFMHHRIKSEHAVGISCDSIEWTILGRHITKLSPYIVAGDYSNFGPSLDLECAKHVGKVWRKWYKYYSDVSEVDDTVRSVLILELCCSIHLVLNVLYRTHAGCPSGSPATVVKNSGVNSLYLRLAWREIFKDDPYMRTMDSFHRNVIIVTYGDDLIMNVSEDAIKFFNNNTLQKFFASHNLKYTDATKQDTVVPYLELGEVTFLKRGFGPHPFRAHILLAGLDKIYLEDIANWIVKAPDRVEQSKDSSVMCCMSAYGHGKEYFNKVRNTLLKAWIDVGNEIYLRSWEEMDDIFFNERDLFARSGKYIFKDSDKLDHISQFAQMNFFGCDE